MVEVKEWGYLKKSMVMVRNTARPKITQIGTPVKWRIRFRN